MAIRRGWPSCQRWRLFLLVLASFTVLREGGPAGRGEKGTGGGGLILAAAMPHEEGLDEKDEFEDLIQPLKQVEVGVVPPGGQGEGEEGEEEADPSRRVGEGSKAGETGASRRRAGGRTAAQQESGEKSYFYEYCGLAVIVLYALAYLRGRGKNHKVERAWVKQFEDLFRHQFASVGPAEIMGPDATAKGELFFKDAESTYLMYATGRRLCKSCLVTLQLRKRHNLFWLLMDLIAPSDDMMTVDVVLNAEDVDPFVFAVVKKKDYRHILSQMPDLKEYCGEHKFSDLPKSFVVLTDCPSVVPDILHPPVVKSLLKHEPLFQLMHFTDQNALPVTGSEGIPKQVARFAFSLPPADRMDQVSKLVEMSMYFIDHLATGIKLSQQAKTKAVNARKEVEQRKFRRMREQRQEQLQRKKSEKLERERQEYDQLTHEQKLRRDARDERKKAKQGGGRLFRKISK